MGFGGGGFNPSPNNIPGPSTQGTELTDKHQFTGSVDITGSLTLNGAAISGGGGGGGTSPGGLNTYIQYNNSGNFAGSANFTFDGNTITVSDDSDITAAIGKATVGNGGLADAATFAHRDHNNVNSYAFRQRGNTGQTDINSANGQPISFQQNGSTQAILDANAQFGIGNGIVPSAVLHVSSSAGTDLFKVEHEGHPDNPILVVTGSGQVGIGTATPSAVLDVDPDNAAGSNSIRFKGSTQATLFHYSAGEHVYLRGGKTTSTIFIGDVRTSDGSSNQKTIIGNAASTTAKLHISSSDNPTVMAVTSNKGDILSVMEDQKVGIGTSAPAASLHVSSSSPDPLLRVDHSTQAGAEPILFVSGSGLVGIGTDTPRTDSGDTNRLHIMGESGADQGQDPVLNSCLTLENNNHVGLQFMFPQGFAGQLTWGTNLNNRKATHYYASDNNRWTWEGRHDGGPVGYGDSRVMTLLAGGDSINIGQINSGHMITNKASLHISSSSDGTDEGGPVLLRVDHGSQSDPVLFVTGSNRVGIGTENPSQALDVAGTANATALSIGGTAISSTAAELNLLDASTVTAPAEGVWAGVERVAVLDIGASEHTIAAHTLGVTIPDKAIITRAILDVGTPFTSGGTPTVGLFTTGNIFPEPSGGAAPIDFFANLGGSPNVPSTVLSTQYSLDLLISGGKLNGASTITFQVQSAQFTAGAAKVYIYYILGS